MALRAPQVVPKGGLLYGILAENTHPGGPMTRKNIDDWIAGTGAPYSYSAVLPGETDVEAYFGVPRDRFYLVQLPSMKILKITVDDSGVALDDLAGRL